MTNQSEKVAIVLHGPPGCGKSKIWGAIEKRCPGAVFESLDDGWSRCDKWRMNGGSERYANIARETAEILVLHLAWGEPTEDMSIMGSTRNAREWVEALRNAGRRVVPFLLWRDLDGLVNGLLQRNKALGYSAWKTIEELGLYCLYEHKHPLATFPSIADYVEETIITSGEDWDALAEQILRRAGVIP